MSLKENWTDQDKFTHDDMKQILNMLQTIDNRLQITYPFPIGTRRNIEIGDDLSGKKLYLQMPNDLVDAILNDVGGGQGNLLSTDQDNSIIEYVNTSNSVATVSINSWMDMLYYANIDTKEVYVNQNEATLSDYFGVVTSLNKDYAVYQYIFIEEEGLEYKLGDFMTSEVLNKLEANLKRLAYIVNTSFEKRDWYYLSVITYKDINRWSTLLNYAYDIVFESSANIVTEAEDFVITENNEYLMTEEE